LATAAQVRRIDNLNASLVPYRGALANTGNQRTQHRHVSSSRYNAMPTFRPGTSLVGKRQLEPSAINSTMLPAEIKRKQAREPQRHP